MREQEHRRWEPSQYIVGSHAWDELYAYVCGYILALEDVHGDLEQLQHEQPVDQDTLAKAWIGVRDTLIQARATLKALEEMEDAHESGRTTQGAPDPEAGQGAS